VIAVGKDFKPAMAREILAAYPFQWAICRTEQK
jgi:hypothetical protein